MVCKDKITFKAEGLQFLCILEGLLLIHLYRHCMESGYEIQTVPALWP